MSKESTKTGVNSPVKFGEIELTTADCIEFLNQHGIDRSTCSVCGSKKNLLLLANSNGAFPYLPTMKKAQVGDLAIPVYLLVCSSCGYIRTFAQGFVASWKEGNKEESSDDEN